MMRALLYLAITGLLTGAAWSAPTAEPACGPYRLAYYEFGSLYYRQSDGKYAGIDKDVVEELARRSGCVFETSLDSRVRIWSQLAEGTLDISTSGAMTADREKKFTFIPYFVSRNYLLVSHDLAKRITSLKAFSADPTLRLAVVKSYKHGTAFDAWIDQLRAQKRVDEYADADVVARVFAAGRADAFLSQPVTWGPLLEKAGLNDKVRMLDLVPNENITAGLVLAKDKIKPDDENRLRKTMRSMLTDGTAEQIFARHVPLKVAHSLIFRSGP
jgi:polar amino acid transport system substrate-binding protein